MVRRLKELITPEQSALADAVCGSAQQIWEAGLGAFARAQKEGGELFDKLVQEGGELARLTQNLAPAKALAAGGAVSRLAENVGRQASGSWEKLEKLFEERVARAMQSLDMPRREDIDALAREVAGLREQLAAQAAPRRPAARKSAAKAPAKTAAKAPAKASALKDTRARTAAAKRSTRAAARPH